MQYPRGQVRDLFERIAPRYDLLNHVLSAGFDFIWRKALVDSCRSVRKGRVLDVATGTGDLLLAAIALSPRQLVGVDLSRSMLSLARKKSDRIDASFVEAAAEFLPLRDGVFDLVMVAFGVRNFSDRGAGLRQLRRVLTSGGSVRILEFSRPHPAVGRIFQPYFRSVLPVIGGWISGHKDAYQYLPDTVLHFPPADEFVHELENAGFTSIRWRALTGGIVTLFEANAGP